MNVGKKEEPKPDRQISPKPLQTAIFECVTLPKEMRVLQEAKEVAEEEKEK